MGWGRTLLLGDIGNRLDIADAEEAIQGMKRDWSRAYRKDLSQDGKIEALIEENSELKLYLASVIRILTKQGIISEEQLKDMVTMIDAEDGQIDGRANGGVL